MNFGSKKKKLKHRSFSRSIHYLRMQNTSKGILKCTVLNT